MTTSLLRASAISGLLKLRDVLASRPDLDPMEAVLFLRQTGGGSASLDLEGGCKLLKLMPQLLEGTPDSVFRECISTVARLATPGWVATLSRGRLSLGESLDENTYQCFRIAGAFDAVPRPEVLQWLDELASAQFALVDRRNLSIGREGERLTLEAEARRLKSLSIVRQPRWVALDDCGAGFDIESWSLDEHGNEMPILIEVKACSAQSCRFFLTRNEWERACAFPAQYQFHVWRLVDKFRAVFSCAEIGQHIPQDIGAGRWESVVVYLDANAFSETELSGSSMHSSEG